MEYRYTTRGVCSRKIRFDLSEDGVVTQIEFTGGCQGNLSAIPKILEGWQADKIIAVLKGNRCGDNETSCADQLAKALEEAKEKLAAECAGRE
ncbi:MAG TPA: TIGR03905 family TSCPD domain-containing protein [Oscillospiraceae bacterium]|nr:TIGR03905 family TSCPD domain-containing protein [Oscillospiraceae bacterium]HNW04949.1 TIGR03905 family TSCPD domain-containing protein [Oscillospiraceae bacterium]HPV99798.1 TIGR03905 family TSCPD domain-containing protein [Oscillospiraceae bacterium]